MSDRLSSVICEIAAVQAQPFQTATSADPGPTAPPAGRRWTLEKRPSGWFVLRGRAVYGESVQVMPVADAFVLPKAVTDEMAERAHDELREQGWSELHSWAESGEGVRDSIRAALRAALSHAGEAADPAQADTPVFPGLSPQPRTGP